MELDLLGEDLDYVLLWQGMRFLLVPVTLHVHIRLPKALQILELVDLTPQGNAPVPPMVPSVNVGLMVGVLAGLLAGAALSVGFAVVAARRLNTSEVLRGGT